MSGGNVCGHVGIVEVTLGGLGSFPAACEKQVVKSGRHIASIWEALGSVVAPLAAMGCFFSDSDCNNSAQKRPKRSYLWLCENSDIPMCLFAFYDIRTSQWTSK